MAVEFPFGDLMGSLDNGRAKLSVKEPQIHVGPRCREFDETNGTYEFPREADSADRKIFYSPLGLRTVQSIPRNPHLPHRVFFHPAMLHHFQ